jgi:hypothetical protein
MPLSNLAFSSVISVPFTGDPVRMRFGFSSKEDPFALAIAMFGGGGWFAIGLGIDGVESLDVGLEFGAMVSLDVGVAEGGVKVVAGIYLVMDQDDSERGTLHSTWRRSVQP